MQNCDSLDLDVKDRDGGAIFSRRLIEMLKPYASFLEELIVFPVYRSWTYWLRYLREVSIRMRRRRSCGTGTLLMQ